jgi:peptidoglycan hydrolase CwlO-like protein
MGPVELLVKGSSFDTIFRKMKYLVESRKNDKVLLEQMKEKETVLDQEEKALAESQLSLETKRKEVEDNKATLFKEKETLASQQSTYAALLDQSKVKEQQLLAELEKNRIAQSAYDERRN